MSNTLPPELAPLPPSAAQENVTAEAAPDSPSVPVPVPRIGVNARGFALAVIATLAFLVALQWAQKFLIPLTFSILISYTLNPVVVWLEKRKIPRAFGTTLVMLTLLVGAGLAANNLHSQFQSIVERLPTTAQKLSRALTQASDGQPTTMQQMQAAAAEIEKATSQATGSKPSPRRAVTAEPSTFKISDWVWAGSLSAVGFIGQATMVLFLVFFLLLAGDTFKRKLVKITGPSLSKKKITVHIMDDINVSIQNYMFMLLVTNLMLAVMMWIALRWIGLENAGAWAVAAGLLHIIPYFGPLIITITTGLTAFMQFGEVSTALLVAGTSLAIATLIGTFVTTWMTGRIAKMNPAAVFIGLLFWGWLWGIWGLLLGIPIIVAIKVVSENVESLHNIAELLGE
ncbi:MAG: AI-2E family transporter [Pseudomonadota bacterium]